MKECEGKMTKISINIYYLHTFPGSVKCMEVIDHFIMLIVVMISWVYTNSVL